MTVTLSLDPEIAKNLKARAEERGVSLDTFLQEVAVKEASTPLQPSTPARRHIADVIRENMRNVPADVMASMPSDGAAQHDHYIYGWPKREV
jgi:hypothetical protein